MPLFTRLPDRKEPRPSERLQLYGLKQCPHCLVLTPGEAVLCSRCHNYIGTRTVPEPVKPR